MLLLSLDDVQAVLDPLAAIDAVEAALKEEAAGQTYLPDRLTTDFAHGWFRIMPGAMVGDTGRPVMGAKLMNFRPGVGLYYLVLLYDEVTGDLLCMMDASALTQIRTGAVAASFVRQVLPQGAAVTGIFGSGYEARGQLRVISRAIPLQKVKVYSPNPANRAAFARELSQELGLDVEAVDQPEQVVAGSQLVIGAVKSQEPVIMAEWFDPGTVVVSIGSTRGKERELHPEVLGRASLVVVDHTQAPEESGDLQAAVAAGMLDPGRVIHLHQVLTGKVRLSIAPERLLIGKPVGTALQDLAVARMVYERCVERGLGMEVPDFLTRKPVARNVMI